MDLRLSEAFDQAADALEWLFGSQSTADSATYRAQKTEGDDFVDLVTFVQLVGSFACKKFDASGHPQR